MSSIHKSVDEFCEDAVKHLAETPYGNNFTVDVFLEGIDEPYQAASTGPLNRVLMSIARMCISSEMLDEGSTVIFKVRNS